jgi:hypothetical protein
VAVVRTAPFAGAVALSTTALPTGVTAAFNPTTTAATAGTSSSTLKLSVSTRGKDGSYSVPIVGTYTSPSGQRYYAYGQLQLVVNSKQTAQPFGLSGTVNKPLAPGSAAQPVDLTISNSNAQQLPVTNLSVMVQGTSAGSACDRTNFAVTQYSGPYPLTVPAGQTRALSSLGVPSSAWPKLQMVNLPRNQDGCKATTVSLDYSGSAQGN